MKIVIVGGTGLIGQALPVGFSKNHQVEVFNRTAFQSVKYLASIIDGSDFVIQLAGSTISKRWSEKIIEEMLLTRSSERQGRLIDSDQSASMEQKKRQGYF